MKWSDLLRSSNLKKERELSLARVSPDHLGAGRVTTQSPHPTGSAHSL